MPAARLGALTLVVTLMLDQASKLALIYVVGIEAVQPIRLAPVLDIVLVWNRGISYGLFQQDSELGRWLLVVGSLVAAVALCVWMAGTRRRVLAVSLGLIAGGAIGNAIDRVVWGAVLDFVYFHVGSFSWYVFNVADTAIVAGVAGLLYDSLVGERSGAVMADRHKTEGGEKA